jgi:hypothetical protein
MMRFEPIKVYLLISSQSVINKAMIINDVRAFHGNLPHVVLVGYRCSQHVGGSHIICQYKHQNCDINVLYDKGEMKQIVL